MAKGWLKGILNNENDVFCTSIISTDFEIVDYKGNGEIMYLSSIATHM